MLSHTWAEDMMEVLEAVNDLALRECKERPSLKGREPDDLVVWFCLFANYQPEDSAGPSISEQLALDPFGNVIRSPALHFMALVVTSVQDPYERLWCVHELDEALDVMEKYKAAGDVRGKEMVIVEWSEVARVKYCTAMQAWAREQAASQSKEYEQWVAGLEHGVEHAYYMATIDCEKATCSRKEDDAMIRSRVESRTTWTALNDRMAKFRIPPGKKAAEFWELKAEVAEMTADKRDEGHAAASRPAM